MRTGAKSSDQIDGATHAFAFGVRANQRALQAELFSQRACDGGRPGGRQTGIVREGDVEAETILLVVAVSLLVTTGGSTAADPDIIGGMHDGDSAAVISKLLPDHPVGTKAIVTLVSLERVLHLDEPFLSTFVVDYLPGGSAVLHRSPTAGYVVVHVLSGAIRAQAWEAGMGTYRAGQTWIEPAVANDITTKNASAAEPARALVVVIANETGSLKPGKQ